jgi:hypothetical protein
MKYSSNISKKAYFQETRLLKKGSITLIPKLFSQKKERSATKKHHWHSPD